MDFEKVPGDRVELIEMEFEVDKGVLAALIEARRQTM